VNCKTSEDVRANVARASSVVTNPAIPVDETSDTQSKRALRLYKYAGMGNEGSQQAKLKVNFPTTAAQLGALVTTDINIGALANVDFQSHTLAAEFGQYAETTYVSVLGEGKNSHQLIIPQVLDSAQ